VEAVGLVRGVLAVASSEWVKPGGMLVALAREFLAQVVYVGFIGVRIGDLAERCRQVQLRFV
jgi:hypothetical protein